MSEKVKVLCVDDDNLNLTIFEIGLKADFETLLADGPEKALELLAINSDVKVVISDFRMGTVDGMEFISKAKKQYPHANYYLFSGFEITKEIQLALDDGLIKRYLTKPLDILEIVKIIKEDLN